MALPARQFVQRAPPAGGCLRGRWPSCNSEGSSFPLSAGGYETAGRPPLWGPHQRVLTYAVRGPPLRQQPLGLPCQCAHACAVGSPPCGSSAGDQSSGSRQGSVSPGWPAR
eukprot:1572446-Alexandrium_andersonii.AAC.1